VNPTTIAVTVVAVLYLLNALGLLDRLGFKTRSAQDADAEISIRDRAIDRLHGELASVNARNAELEASRSMTPVLEQLKQSSELQAQVLDRLVHHNGSFRHMETSLREIAEGFKLMTGFIAGAVGVPKSDDTA
jgi:hypothetical protein